jgi:hypothetical protein
LAGAFSARSDAAAWVVREARAVNSVAIFEGVLELAVVIAVCRSWPIVVNDAFWVWKPLLNALRLGPLLELELPHPATAAAAKIAAATVIGPLRIVPPRSFAPY